MRWTRFGQPLPLRPQSASSTLIVDPRPGFRLDVPPSGLPLGATPSAQNYIVRDSALEPRGALTLRSVQSLPNSPVLGGLEAVDVLGNTYPLGSLATQPVWFSVGSWSLLSYVSAFGVNDPPVNSGSTRWDMTQVYSDRNDENVVLMASPSYQSLYVWKSNDTIFSTLTGAPRARAVAVSDNYVLAMNIREGSNDFVQRVQWSDRGSVSSWTGGLSGFLDILDAKGQGTRMIPQEDRVVTFTDRETWALIPAGGIPTAFNYVGVDRTVGCPFPGTAVDTPRGVLFMGQDYNVYLLPRGGGVAEAVGTPIHRELRENIDFPSRAWGLYNRETDQFELNYPVRGGSGFPERGLYLSLRDGAWMPQRFLQSLTAGWMGSIGTSSKATTWADLAAAGIRWADLNLTWGQLSGGGGIGPLAAYAGSSAGSFYFFSSTGTLDDTQPVTMRWQSSGFGGMDPTKQKTLYQVLVDYQADSASSMTVRCSADGGRSFDQGMGLALPAASVESQARFDIYCPARYPVIEIVADRGRARVFRLHATYRGQGR